MSLIRMHAAVREQAKEMQLATTGAGVLHSIEQHGMLEEFAVLDHQLNASGVHVNDAPGTNVEVTDFAVAHLAFGKSDVWPAGLNQRVGILAKEAVVRWLARECDCVGFGFGAVTPAVENRKNERFRTRHKCSF
jgi:hypothetical protein